MKQWWTNLSIREQKIIIIATAILIIMIAYFLIWSPLSDSVNMLQRNVTQDRELLSWMKATVPHIAASNQNNTLHPITEAELFSTVQQSLLSSGLKSSLQNIEQQKEGTVKLSFKSVSFDKLIDWLISLQQNFGINPVEVSLDKNNEGLVKGSVILQTIKQ
jgi:general secretion pathway protein M